MVKYLINIEVITMASFVVHYIAGEKLLESLNNIRDLTETEKNNFRLGNLIVDSLGFNKEYTKPLNEEELLESNKRYRETKITKKIRTHFRDKDSSELCCNLPNPDAFMNKYHNLVLKDFFALGYLFHLYTDKIFFTNFYENIITCLDKNKNPTNKLKENVYIKINKNNKIYSYSDFWYGQDYNIYNDYTKMNSYLLNKYEIKFDNKYLQEFANTYLTTSPIEEVELKDIYEVLEKTEKYINESQNKDYNNLIVFTKEDLCSFIPLVVKRFYKHYYQELNYLLKH